MCDAGLSLGLATVGGAVNLIEGQRRDANKAMRQQNSATTAMAEALKNAGSPSITPSLPEPVKDASASIDAARDKTSRQQLLRKGLMSTFTRYGGGSASTAAPNLTGKSKLLGG